jgi:hypothetical protein
MNFADHEASSGDFEPIPTATYPAVIYEYEEDTVRELDDDEVAGKDGAPKFPGERMIKWTFKLTEEPYEGRYQWTNTVLAGGGLGMLKSLILATGLYTQEEVDDPDFDFDPDTVLGEPVKLKVKKNPKTRHRDANNSVKAVLPADSSDVDSNDLPG